MARPKEFDRDDVVDKAMAVFWARGFEATSVQDLVDATGVNRGSLYNTFVDKAGLFDAVMDRYLAVSPVPVILGDPESAPPRATIERLFRFLVEDSTAERDHLGCLLTNTAVELAPRDPAMAAKVAAALRSVEDALARLIVRGQAAGEIAPWHQARRLARFLVSSAQGMRVMARVGGDPAILEDTAETVLRNLD